MCDQEDPQGLSFYWMALEIDNKSKLFFAPHPHSTPYSHDEDCQRMNTVTFEAAAYTHIVYSFASIDSSYRLEA